MKPVSKLLLFGVYAGVGLFATVSTSCAQQSYPNKPLRMIAPSSAGGPVDLICRAIGQGLGEMLGQQIVIENRAGAAGLIGTEVVAKSAPDGYTLLFGFSGPLAIVPNLNDAAPGMTALMAGEVDMMFNAIPPTFPHIKSGKVRALAVGGAKRSQLLPNVPTIRESGYDFVMAGWYGVLAPKGTPQPIVAKLHTELVRALKTPEMKERFKKLEVEEIGTTPEEFANHMRQEFARWAKVIQAAGLKGK